MLERKKGIDIVMHLGGIDSFDVAMDIMQKKMDKENLNKIQKINNSEVILKIANAIVMCDPETVFINTGSEEDRQRIRELAIKQGEEAELPMKDHTIHYDLKDEQGRVVDRTYYIANEGEKISVLANKMLRADAIKEVQEKMTGIMKGRTMMVGFYMRGPVGSPASNPAIEITSSAYVSHSAETLYRNAFADFEKEVENKDHCYTNIHSEEPPEKGRNFQGEWRKGMTNENGKPIPISHPNARCFFGSSKIADDKKPVMAGPNYFLTEETRGGTSKKLLGEKRDRKDWLHWLWKSMYIMMYLLLKRLLEVFLN